MKQSISQLAQSDEFDGRSWVKRMSFFVNQATSVAVMLSVRVLNWSM